MTSEPTIREKGRAVFLAAIMVLSAVAMSAAFAGSAAAITPQEVEVANASSDEFSQNIEGNSLAGGLTYNVVNETDGDTMYVGENNVTVEEGEEIHLMDSDDNNVDDILVRENDDDKPYFELDLDDLDGTYTLSDTPTASGEFTEEFSVSPQDVEADWDVDTVNDGSEDVEVELDLDRNVDPSNYNVSVWADGLDYDEIAAIFDNESSTQSESVNGTLSGEHDGDYVPFQTLADDFDVDVDPDDRGTEDGQDALEDAGIVTLELNETLPRDSDLSLFGNFSNLDEKEGLPDPGDYEFEFLITDTGDHATDELTIEEEDVDAEFDQGVYTQTAGDIVEFTVEFEDTDEGYVQFGDEDAGFVDALWIEDDSGNDEVTFYVNTRMVGANVSDIDDVYYAPDDNIESVFLDSDNELEGLEFYDGDTDGQTLSYQDYLVELDLIDDGDNIDDQLVRPLQATSYDIAVGSGDFIADSGDSEIDDEYDEAILDLTDPGVGSANTWVAPSDDADADDELDDVLDVVTERSDIAVEDRLVIEVEATGMYGLLANQSSNDLDEIDGGVSANDLYEVTNQTGEGINFEVEADDAVGNQDPTELNLEDAEDDDAYVLVNHDEGVFYVIVNTDSDGAFSNGEFDDGQSWTAEFEYETDSEDRFRFADNSPFGGADGDTNEAAFPYFGTDSSESVTTSFDAEDPDVSFDNLNEDDEVQLENSEESVVTAETNVAPGSDATFRISNAGDTPSFLSTEDAEIDSDGTVESEHFDFSDRDEGDQAEIDFRISGDTIDDADGIFVEAVEEVDDEDVDEEDDEEVDEEDDHEDDDADDHVDEDDDHVDEDDDHVDEDDDDDEVETEDDGVPGFGIAVALFALIAAGMLALRRQN